MPSQGFAGGAQGSVPVHHGLAAASVPTARTEDRELPVPGWASSGRAAGEQRVCTCTSRLPLTVGREGAPRAGSVWVLSLGCPGVVAPRGLLSPESLCCFPECMLVSKGRAFLSLSPHALNVRTFRPAV